MTSDLLSTQLSLIVAAGTALGTCTLFYVFQASQRFLMYAAVVLFGCGTSLMIYTVSVLLVELSVMDKQTGGNAVGALVVLDRAVLGVVVLFLQLFYPETYGQYGSLYVNIVTLWSI